MTINTHPLLGRLALAGGAAAVALALAGCDRADNKTAGQQLDTAIAKTEQAARDAKATTESLAADAKAKIDEKAPAAESAVKDGAARASEATREAGAAIAGAVDDATITATVSAGLAKDSELSALRIDVDTKAGVVTLKGPAPNAAAKARAEEIARSVKGVSRVDNALEIRAS
ncbi:MAG: BON domain-containing protein [Proteobacteria bacterium]|nr:BON domain-containing protein [Pseudomonadota bacterium]